jgi:hypothetical protein
MAMIESSEQLTLDRLNLLTQVWLEYDYHRNLHSEIGTTPLTRFIEAPSVGRNAPDSQGLRRAFRKHVVRRQRRSDGTCTLDGKRFEIPSRFGHLESITLSYARWDLANVELIDPDTGVVLSRVYPLDKHANADASRRAREARHTPTASALAVDHDLAEVLVLAIDEQGLSPLMRKHLQDYAATGLSPGFIPSPQSDQNTDNTP